ncbi:unnamed protein product, partial [Prorocentrum cordatum]
LHPQGATAPAVLARLSPDFGQVRCWNFRSKTGFTAVGLRPRAREEPEVQTCGVLFPASSSMDAFDAREVGYRREQLDPAHI